MNFREFFSSSEFTLYATGDSNWDLYTMQYKDTKPCLVALAKEGSGAKDCFFGGMDYLEKLEYKGINHGFIRVQ